MLVLLADHLPDSPNAGWWVGLIVGSALVVVAVAAVAALLTYASRIEGRTEDAIKAIAGAREGAEPMAAIERATGSAAALVETVRAARGALPGGLG